ncbi:CAP domain-containing protein [Nakamurella deserti]|uniref:CAP domain-containing protein n=1 Tax=Nakamurella deserti TaxID=2164074 RepID=UPI0013009C7F|nr:CAP domain-containing protein [Nakamurella deserti]
MTPVPNARARSGGQRPAVVRALAGVAVAAVVGGLLVPVATSGPAAAAPAPSAAAVVALPVVTQDVSPLDVFDAELLRLVNAARAGAGVAPVQEARGLDRLSAWWSGQLAAGTGTLAHNPTGLAMVTEYGAGTRTLWAENVAKLSPASAVTAQSLFDTYLASPTHRANILNPKFGYIGVGSVTAAGISFNTVNFTDAVDAGQTFDPRAAATPVGQFQSLTATGATVRLTGWGLDPELATAASTIRVTDTAPDGSVATSTAQASIARPELAADRPASGAAHGFDHSYVTAGRGGHTVCATVVDTGAGLGDTALGCLTYTVGDPVGGVESATVTGRTLTVAGWAVDPDQPTAAATVTVTDRLAGGPATSTTVVASAPHAGADRAVPGAGPAHGFTVTAPISGVGEHAVCATVAGVRAAGVVTDLGCRTVTVTPATPVGAFDTVGTPDRRSVSVTGWAADPDAPTTPSTVAVVITNSAGTTTTTLDAATGYPVDLGSGLGRDHAFSATLPLTADGVNTVCVRSVSRSTATVTTDLGCRTVTVAWMHGWLDKITPATAGGVRTLTVAGWAIDQGVPTTPTPVQLKVTGPSGYTTTTTVTANASRADVGRAFPGTGANHGYLATLKVPAAGSYQVCATEVSPRNPALTKLLRCLSVTVG